LPLKKSYKYIQIKNDIFYFQKLHLILYIFFLYVILPCKVKCIIHYLSSV